jgi:hypothetical protein
MFIQSNITRIKYDYTLLIPDIHTYRNKYISTYIYTQYLNIYMYIHTYIIGYIQNMH